MQTVDILIGLLKHPRIEREIGLMTDLIFGVVFYTIPGILGWVLGIGYLATRDCLWFANYQCFGKHLYGMHIVKYGTTTKAPWHIAFARNMILCLPIINLVDIWYFIVRGRRLADFWLDTDVVELSEELQTSKKSNAQTDSTPEDEIGGQM